MQPKTSQLLKDLQDLILTLKNKPKEVTKNPLKDLWLSKHQRIRSEVAGLATEERQALETAYSQWWSESKIGEKPLDRILPF